MARSSNADMEEETSPQLVIYTPGEQVKTNNDNEASVHEPQIVESDSDKDGRKVPDYLYSNTIPMLMNKTISCHSLLLCQ